MVFLVQEHVPERQKANIDMWKVTGDERIEFERDQFGWCASQKGCLVVRLVQNGRVENCVLVNGLSNLIYDSADASPLQLTSQSLRLCSGPRVPKLEVKEVRHLRKQRDKKRQSSGKRKHNKEAVKNEDVPKRVWTTRSTVIAGGVNSSIPVVDLTDD